MMASPSFLGLDLSTQQLKAVILDVNLRVLAEAHVDFDKDLASYRTKHGVHTGGEDENVITAPVAMWLAAIDLLLQKLQTFDLSSVVAISGAGMQHGTVYWSGSAEMALENLDSKKPLADQNIAKTVDDIEAGALSLSHSPNWQDASTGEQCDEFENSAGGAEQLATITGSKAHHRFSGPQILKLRRQQPDVYQKTARISLVSSFLATIFLGQFAPIDIADACGMNLLDMGLRDWDPKLLKLTAGNDTDSDELRPKLGKVNCNVRSSLGNIAKYFVERYDFSKHCRIYPFTGDNPATILSLPLKENEAIVSLGTSTTFLMSTANYQPHPDHHFMHHPTTEGLYMFMLCYKNGSLAREQIRDAIEPTSVESRSWSAFDTLLTTTPVLGRSSPNSPARLGLYFPRTEILPAVAAGVYRALYSAESPISLLPEDPDQELWDKPNSDARAIVESQFLSIRLRIAKLAPTGLKRIYLAGGAACNDAIAQICGDVLGSEDGVWRLQNVVGGACAVGAANRAAWGWNVENNSPNQDMQTFEEYLASKWTTDDQQRLFKICESRNDAVWHRYGEALDGMRQIEQLVQDSKKQ